MAVVLVDDAVVSFNTAPIAGHEGLFALLSNNVNSFLSKDAE